MPEDGVQLPFHSQFDSFCPQAGGGGEDRCCRGRFCEYNCTMANIGISSSGAKSVIHPAGRQDHNTPSLPPLAMQAAIKHLWQFFW